jgi:hypothetical protein
MEVEMRRILGVPLLFLLFAIPSNAQEQRTDMDIGRGVLCDTAQQMGRFVALRDNGKDVAVALDTVNDEAHLIACNVALVMFTAGKPIGELIIRGKLVSVIQITVHAISNGSAWKKIPELTQYTAVVEGTAI